MSSKITASLRVVNLVLLAALLVSTFMASPQELGPFGITAWFGALLVVTTSFISQWLWRRRYDSSKEGFWLALRRAFLISVWLVALLALNSLRQLGIRDIILIIVLGLLVDFYLRRIEK